ncbi:related to E.coli prolyl-tRNA synthetase [Ramularia collo-cygni]|uniref:proline--tRNA ligase n=1 Tax=Ramularia collo-cygni TaxID=112498 RepID=A0A2D3UQV2_9PEZI|nr:related to E.coli prolyl-tRNA synthetase [Ramularia collo-cygni]CZT16778.1 related to E.coli prolyl-tRNA synthetase [Ramularia collo-cygni]
MPAHDGLQRLWRWGVRPQRRGLHTDGRNRLSNFWTPTQNKPKSSSADDREDGYDLLVRAGFLRQAHAGVFHLLPLGLRVQDNIERLIDKHMRSVGASKVSLSSLSSQALWERSGRLEGKDSELFRLEDRKGSRFLLSPTHEEEITSIVKHAVQSYKDLPLRLYQVSRKYRDEARPRQGLLRGREFVMKDLYTFDITEQKAMETYADVSKAYRGFLDDVNLPYLVADAASGSMGGSHSHEYHFSTDQGEDSIISCRSCKYTVNEELWRPASVVAPTDETNIPFQTWVGRTISPVEHSIAPQPQFPESVETAQVSDRTKELIEVFLPQGSYEINIHALKELVKDLDTSGKSIAHLLKANSDEQNVSKTHRPKRLIHDPRIPRASILKSYKSTSAMIELEDAPFSLTKPRPDDACPSCGAKELSFSRAVEIGHTFHLGTRYSKPFDATFKSEQNTEVEIQMGCHGIGVSRLIGAVASLLADDKGLNWPASIAPFVVNIIGAGSTTAQDLEAVYDQTSQTLDAIIDDRERPMGWKLNDADLIGYPFIVILGKAWKQRRAVELQCRRLGVREEVGLEDLVERMEKYSEKL